MESIATNYATSGTSTETTAPPSPAPSQSNEEKCVETEDHNESQTAKPSEQLSKKDLEAFGSILLKKLDARFDNITGEIDKVKTVLQETKDEIQVKKEANTETFANRIKYLLYGIIAGLVRLALVFVVILIYRHYSPEGTTTSEIMSDLSSIITVLALDNFLNHFSRLFGFRF